MALVGIRSEPSNPVMKSPLGDKDLLLSFAMATTPYSLSTPHLHHLCLSPSVSPMSRPGKKIGTPTHLPLPLFSSLLLPLFQ